MGAERVTVTRGMLRDEVVVTTVAKGTGAVEIRVVCVREVGVARVVVSTSVVVWVVKGVGA